ncbi:MAG: three-Cys-motif partner protein TcmP [Planctomycetota bacterium]
MTALRFDEVGNWSEVKLAIVRDYAQEYSKILHAQTSPKLHHAYIDAFSGPGIHISKATGEFIPGSPLNALLVRPPFREYHFVDLDGGKAGHLRDMIAGNQTVNVYEGDCNQVLLEKVFPRVRFEDYKRALCLLDPYGLHLDWRVMRKAGTMKSVEIFLNFPIMDMNMNVLWHNPDKVDDQQAQRMDRYWGDRSWRNVAYSDSGFLPGFEGKTRNEDIAAAFRARLRREAGFAYVPEPMPMRNSTGATVYYLYFASQNRVGKKIVEHIFRKYGDAGI